MNAINSEFLSNGYKLQNGKYRIEKKIGQGGFGIVYLARWYQNIKGTIGVAHSYSVIVIKELFWSKYCNRHSDGHTVNISTEEGKEMMKYFKEKLKKEGTIISRLSYHPNIVSILDIFEENNTAYLVMQYIEGKLLSEIIEEKEKIAEPVVLNYAKQICNALEEIHSKRILHLDLKPSNIIIDEDDNVYIFDFGISKQFDKSAEELSDTPLGVTAGYSPIEQYGTLESFSPYTDIYALGATMYKMLTGKTPIAATSRCKYDLKPVSYYTPEVSKKTEDAIIKAMSEKSCDRFQTVQEFWKALNQKEVYKLYSLYNSDSIINNGLQKTEKIINDTDVDKQPQKDEKRQISKPEQSLYYEPERSKPWVKYLISLSGAAAVLAIIFILLDDNYINGSAEQGREVAIRYNELMTMVEQNLVNAAPNNHLIAHQSANQPKIKKVTAQNEQDNKKTEKPKKNKEKNDLSEAANLVQQANNVFSNISLGSARYEQSHQLYMKAKELNGDVSAGYSNYLMVAKSLIANGSGFDLNVKKMLQYAQQLNNTREVRDLLAKCN